MPHRYLRLVVTVLFSLALNTLPLSKAWSAEKIRIGILAWQGTEESEIQWASLGAQLKKQLPRKSIALYHYNLADLAAALREGKLDFVVTNPGHYVLLEAESGVTRIATQISDNLPDPDHVVGSALVVRADRQDLIQLADLKGKTIAAVSPFAFGGYQLAWAELRHNGIDPEKGDLDVLFTNFPMSRVVEAVLKRDADAGVLRACLLEKLEHDGLLKPGTLRVLSQHGESAPCRVTSKLYPGWAFASATQTSPELSREVLLALLSLPPDHGGLSWTVPADYHPVHEILRELKIGPYSFLRETGWDSLFNRYWPWAAGLAVMLLIGVGYTLQVERLVKRRTKELSLAIEERQKLETSIQAGQQQMDHLSRLSILGELSGTLAHELNQPLATIGNYARSILRRQEKGNLLPDALRQAANEIAHESERAAGVLSSIRSFARKRSRIREVRDVAEIINEAGKLLTGVLNRGPTISLRHKLDQAERLVFVDPLQIQQVLLNLYKNAWDAQAITESKDPIEVGLYTQDGKCVVTVRDHGPGLTQEFKARIFEPFFTTKPEGLGLGLSICKTIIEAHGGELHAADAEPGLMFSLTLPIAGTTTTDSLPSDHDR